MHSYVNGLDDAAVNGIVRYRTTGGKVYEQVKVLDVDAVRMQVKHSNGITGIPWQELPEEMQDRFQFSDQLHRADFRRTDQGPRSWYQVRRKSTVVKESCWVKK